MCLVFFIGPVVKSGITSPLHGEVRGSNPHESTIFFLEIPLANESNVCYNIWRFDEVEEKLEVGTSLFDNWTDDFLWETSGVGTATDAD